jgi:cell division protein FtsB
MSRPPEPQALNLRKTQPSGPEPLRRHSPAPQGGWDAGRRLFQAALIFVTIVLLVDALVGEKGFVETIRARRQSVEVASALDAVRRDNMQLREQARRLREDPGAIESLAREDLGLIRPGELLFIIKDAKPAKTP